MPYGMIVPRDLDNVWLACRAIGVSPDAHHSCRMQRDIQRIGEAAGNAAALAVKHQADARHIPIDQLHEALARTGAIDMNVIDVANRDFGPPVERDVFQDSAGEALRREGFDHLRAGEPHATL